MKRIFCLMLSVLILSGCWDTQESERMLYTLGIGVDYQDGQYELYVQIVNFLQVAKTEEPKGEAEQSAVGRAKGKTIDEAIFNLYNTMDEKVNWGHLAYVILSEEFLKAGKTKEVIDMLTRFNDTRYHIYFYSTNENLTEVLLMVPIIKTAITLSQLSRPSNAYAQDSFVEPLDMRQLIIGINEPSHEVKVPYITVIKNFETVADKTNTIKLSGVGVITPDSFKGFITGYDANGLQWMNPKTKRGNITFLLHDSDDNSSASAALTNVGVKVKPVIEDDAIKFDINVNLTATVSSITEDMSTNELKKLIAEKVKQEIEKTYQVGLEKDVDIYRLSEHAYRKENKAWKKHEEAGKIQLNEDSIRSLHVKVNEMKAGRKELRRTFE